MFFSIINFSLLLGISRSSLPNEIPTLNACLKPKVFILSQKITVSFCPQYLKIVSITSETFFLVKILSIRLNFIFEFKGRRFANKNLPAVLVCFSIMLFPFASIVLKVDIILECKLIDLFSRACSISSTLEKMPLGFFSFSKLVISNIYLKQYTMEQ